jgi:hypothetical protein
MKQHRSLPCSQQPVNCPCIEPVQCILVQDLILVIRILILKFHLCLGLPSGCFPIVPTRVTFPVRLAFLFYHAKLCWTVQTTNVFIMHLSPVFCQFLVFISNCLRQYPQILRVLRYSQRYRTTEYQAASRCKTEYDAASYSRTECDAVLCP